MSSLPQAGQADFFPTTRWTLVATAQGDEGEAAAKALNDLCQMYRGPVLAYLEKRFPSRADAEDMVQDYFESLLRRKYWAAAAPGRGRFRMFLLHDLKLFLKSAKRRMRAVKRGADAVHLPLEAVEQEVKPGDDLWTFSSTSAEESYHRAWAVEVFSLALKRLAQDYATPCQRTLFDLLRPHLDRRGSAEFYQRVALHTGKSESAVARQFCELKQRLRFHLQILVSDTVPHPSELEDELNLLFRALGSHPAVRGDESK